MRKKLLTGISSVLLSTQVLSVESTSEKILNYWFGSLTDPSDYPSDKASMWFSGKELVDKEIRDRFSATLHQATQNELDEWADTPRGRLALIVLLDQFTRNIYRDDGQAFAYDHLARKLALEGIVKGHDRALYPVERIFFYLPFEHAENRDLQVLSVALFQQIVEETSGEMRTKALSYLKYAGLHKVIVDRFGRYPHRNKLLGRDSTADEIEFLKQPNSSF
jgi:uncharacterized protein (DUF924 family)